MVDQPVTVAAALHSRFKLMAQQQSVLINAFNRGIMSPLALARTDLKRTTLSAETQTNWMPRSLGSMMLRPGLEYISSTRGNLTALHIPFIFSSSDTAIIELTNNTMRVLVDETVISRGSVSTVVTNDSFGTDLAGWTDADEAGGASAWVTGGYMGLTGDGINVALRTQEVTVAAGDQGDEHALRITVARGPIRIRVGSTTGDDDYIAESELRTGTYSLAFTPTGNFHIWLFSSKKSQKLISSCAVETSGEMQLTTTWGTDDLDLVRWDQSGDVVFAACQGQIQRRIERYGTRSWGIANYTSDNGPFRIINTSSKTITPSALSGNITLTASFKLFNADHVGALYRITSIGQNVALTGTGDNQWSDPIQVTGVGGSRAFLVTISGTWTTTVTLQRSIGAIGSWEDSGTAFTSNVTNQEVNDGLDNQIIFYRIGFSTGWDSGSAVIGISYSSGSITGTARVTAYTSATVVSAEVLTSFGALSASVLWSEGAWSDYRGYPSAVAFHEGRLWWSGKDKIWGSVSDGFEDFNDETEGDSAPISRSLGSGPVDRINWLLPLQRLVIGTDMAERVARSSSLDEPLTTTNFNLKTPSTRGSTAVAPIKVDIAGMFVRNGRLFQLSYQGGDVDFTSEDLTVIAPEVGESGFVRIAVQRYPDTRIHCVRTDGTVAVLVYDVAEEIRCWVLVETDGIVEGVFVIPGGEGSAEDKVYYVVKRTIDGNTVRYLEKWALESECMGDYSSKLADSFVVTDNWIYPGYTLTPSATTGTITLTTSGAYWSSGYVGQVVRINGGRATITEYTSTTVVTATVTTTLTSITPAVTTDWSHAALATTMTGLSHLEGETVVVWADGIDIGTKVVSSGTITLATGAIDIMAGLAYTAQYKSTKLAYAAALGTALTQVKRVNSIGVIMKDTHALGLQYGPDFDNLDDMPLIEDGALVGANTIHSEYDKGMFEFPGDYDTDSRLCLQAAAPRPCTLLACVIEIKTSG